MKNVALAAAGFTCLHMGFVLFCSPATVVCFLQPPEQKPLACFGGTNFKETLCGMFLFEMKTGYFFPYSTIKSKMGKMGVGVEEGGWGCVKNSTYCTIYELSHEPTELPYTVAASYQ